MSSGGTGGGGIVLARKKTDGTTSYASLTDEHFSHILNSISDPDLHAKLSNLISDDEKS